MLLFRKFRVPLLWVTFLILIPSFSMWGTSWLAFVSRNLGRETLAWGIPALLALGILLCNIEQFRQGTSAVAWLSLLAWPAAYVLWDGLPLVTEQVHLLLFGAFGAATRRSIRGPAVWAWILGLSLGDELLQGVLPHRYFDWRDVGFNAAAGLVGGWVVPPGPSGPETSLERTC